MTDYTHGTVPAIGVRATPREGPGFEHASQPLEALLFANLVGRDSDQPLLRCARCGSTTASVHHVDIRRGHDAALDHGLRVYPSTETVLLAPEAAAASGTIDNNGATVTVVFHCDLGHYFALELGAHKGHSLAAVFSWDDEHND